MAPMWHILHEIRAMITKKSHQRKSSTQDLAKRYNFASNYLPVSTKARRSSVKRLHFISELEKSTAIDEFELLDVLGQGTFGSVHLARHLDTGAAVAIKILLKAVMLDLRQESNVLREQSIHLGLKHPFIAKLYATFQDKEALYFVLEFCPGGELYNLVYMHDDRHEEENEKSDDLSDVESRQRGSEIDEPEVTESESDEEQSRPSFAVSRNRLSLDKHLSKQELRSSHGGLYERYVAFYAACLVTALESLHMRGILYRDLKLENLVLDAAGYLKLIDFGLAKSSETEKIVRSSTMCGSFEFMAPEILKHEVYDQRVDLWSFGILLYEMLFGVTPFHHANHREQGRRILSEPVHFPSKYEQQHTAVCSLIQNLLEKDPAQRIATFTDVKKTVFFRTYFPSAQRWQELEARKTEPPFVPRLNGLFDTSLFLRVSEEHKGSMCSDADSDFGY